MMKRLGWMAAILLGTSLGWAQGAAVWQMEESGTTAGLRGIYSVDGQIVWASGTEGTVLRTVDGGQHWQRCATPDGDKDGATLDFRGVQAWDAKTAIVMASGPGEKSRLYKTTDGCGTWGLLFTNPDKDGFWDAFVARIVDNSVGQICKNSSQIIEGAIMGDPAVHKFNQKDTTQIPSFYLAGFEVGISCPEAALSPSASSIFSLPSEAAFAASNTVLKQIGTGYYWLVTRFRLTQYMAGFTEPSHYFAENFCDIGFPFSDHSESAGAFSLAIRPDSLKTLKPIKIGGFHWKAQSCQKADMVVVGGNYKDPDNRKDTAAYTGGTNRFQLGRVHTKYVIIGVNGDYGRAVQKDQG